MAAPKGNKNAKGNKGGRPTKFDKSYVDSLRAFFSVEPLKKEVTKKSVEYFKSGKVRKKQEEWRYVPEKLPTLYGFAKSIGVAYVTVLAWQKEGEGITEPKDEEEKAKIEFSNAYKEAKEEQKEFLMRLGLSGASPSGAYIFTAKNVTDMRDKQEVEHSGRVILTDEQRRRIIEREAKRIGRA